PHASAATAMTRANGTIQVHSRGLPVGPNASRATRRNRRACSASERATVARTARAVSSAIIFNRNRKRENQRVRRRERAISRCLVFSCSRFLSSPWRLSQSECRHDLQAAEHHPHQRDGPKKVGVFVGAGLQ